MFILDIYIHTHIVLCICTYQRVLMLRPLIVFAFRSIALASGTRTECFLYFLSFFLVLAGIWRHTHKKKTKDRIKEQEKKKRHGILVCFFFLSCLTMRVAHHQQKPLSASIHLARPNNNQTESTSYIPYVQHHTPRCIYTKTLFTIYSADSFLYIHLLRACYYAHPFLSSSFFLIHFVSPSCTYNIQIHLRCYIRR